MRSRRFTRPLAGVAALTVLAVAAGCTRTSEAPGLGTANNGGLRLYGADSNMNDSFGDTLADQPGVLAGMKGTTPLNPLTADLRRRLLSVDSTLKDFTFSAEMYDATMILALAAETAKATDGATMSKYVNGVTVGGQVCDTIKACLDLAHTGKDLRYRGASLRRSGFTDAGEPSTGTYGTLNFGRDNRIDDGKTEYVGAGDETTETRQPQPAPAVRWGRPEPLRIGGLLPHTGSLSYIGPQMTAAVRLAVKEVNEAGGVLGQPVEFVDGDDGTSADVSSATLDRLIGQGITAVVGPCCSGISLKILPKAVEHGVAMISIATSDALTSADDRGLFFRTSPPDNLQARALADIVMRDGSQRVAVVARDDAYGLGLQRNLRSDLVKAGIRSDDIQISSYKTKDKYDDKTDLAMFAPIARSIRQFRAEAVVIIGFEESGLLIKALLAERVELRHE